MKTIIYNTSNFDFKSLVLNKFKVNSLSKIHNNQNFISYQKFTREKDQSTIYHKSFYELAREKSFIELYRNFISEHIKPIFGEEVVYQKIPTFRIHFPGNIAVGEYHRDRNYRDPEWAKKVKEFNFFLPLTMSYGTNTIWVESEEGKEDFSPIISKYGEVIMWDGSNLLHGNKTNNEKDTRISFDFRVMPLSRYEESNHGSINMNSKFAIGGYYEKI